MTDRSRVETVVLVGKPDISHARADQFESDAKTEVLEIDPAGNLAAAFLRATRHHRERPAFITPSGTYSYRWLEAAATTVRDSLLRSPFFEAAAPVAMLVGNSPAYAAAFYGTLLAGGVAVPLPPETEADRRDDILKLCGAAIVLSTPEILSHRGPVAEGPLRQLDLNSKAEAAAVADEVCQAAGDGLASIFFTAGSTGTPKGAMLSHRNLLSNAWSICQYLNISSNERALAVLPFYHAFGNSVFQTHILRGASLVLDGSVMFPNSIIESIRRHRVTSFSGVPEVYEMLLSRSAMGEQPLRSLRYMTVAGGALRGEQAHEVARRIHPAKFYIMYGQTEATARLSYLPPEEMERRPGSIGKGIPGVELQVVDESGQPVSPGHRGEIRARGPNVMMGYWKDPQGTSQVIRDGWLYTGDWATVDSDGFIYPQGRSSAWLKVGGFRVHPQEVEEIMMKRLPLLRAVVVSYEQEGFGTRMALFIQPRPGQQPPCVEEVWRLCQEELPRYKVPAYVEIIDRVPLNEAMKVDRPALSRRARDGATKSR